MNAYTRAGLRKVRAAGPGSRVRALAPASPMDREGFDAGIRELERLGFVPVYDERVFERTGYVAGTAASRAAQWEEAVADPTVDVIVGVRGGFGSVQMLPLLTAVVTPDRVPPAFVGYSDLTSLHSWLGCQQGIVSLHGPMLDRRLAHGAEAYDVASLLAALTDAPMGLLAPQGLEVVRAGEASGPLFGGTISQLLGSLGTPWPFTPPQGCVLWLDEVGERPYRLDRMFVQLAQSGILARAAAVVVGQLPQCDEPAGGVTGRAVVADALRDFPGPVLLGFPSGHTTTPLITLPLGVHARVVTGATPGVVIEESAVVEDQR